MTSFAHRSFLYGVFLASVTWAASLYLYFTLTNGSDRNNTLSSSSSTFSSDNDEDAYIPLRNSFKLPNLNDAAVVGALEKDDTHDSHDPIPLPRYESKWREKFRKLVEISEKDETGTEYVNSERLVKTLKERTKVGLISAKDSIGLVKTLEEKKVREEGYRKHAFNALISGRIGFHRDIPDTRHKRCASKKYPRPEELPGASVIICFYNEEFNALMRTVHSVLDRSNGKLLREILLVDDSSDLDNLHERLRKYSKHNFPSKVKLLKTPRREGLIRARIFGARQATSEVLVFLDSHVETNIGWLEPLLSRIHENRKVVVTPIIDIVNADTFEYTPSPIVKGGFTWGLHFRWNPVPKSEMKTEDDYTKPIASPTMAGGLFAIDRKYFTELGEYDEGMDVWGAENIEISLRIWMCGGRLEILPCSRVGHVFRKRRPYGSEDGVDTTKRNSIRVAEVWMDEYKKKYYDTHADAKNMLYGDISSRVKLRERLSCHSFHWYLQNVHPEMLREGKASIQALDRDGDHSSKKKVKETFLLRLSNTKLCVESINGVTQKHSRVALGKCESFSRKKQRWSATTKHELLLAELLCLDAGSDTPKLKKCHESGGTQEWKWAGVRETPIFNIASGMCLGVEGRVPKQGDKVKMVICDETNGKTFLKFDLLHPDDAL